MNGVAKNQEELLGLKTTTEKNPFLLPSLLELWEAQSKQRPKTRTLSEPWGPVQPGGFCEQETTSPPALE